MTFYSSHDGTLFSRQGAGHPFRIWVDGDWTPYSSPSNLFTELVEIEPDEAAKMMVGEDATKSDAIKAGSDCGANAPGGGGFQMGNTCAAEDGGAAGAGGGSGRTYSKQSLSEALDTWMSANDLDVSKKWNRSRGYLPLPDEETIKSVAAEQQAAAGQPYSAAALKSYESFKAALGEQFEAIQAAGLKVYAWEGDGEPYRESEDNIWAPSSKVMREKVEQTGEFHFFMTEKGFGAEGASAESSPVGHPLLRVSPYKTADGKSMLWNDVFRVTHDMVAHIEGGFSFSTRGEYNGAITHASTLPEAAHAALFSETFAQNAVYEVTGKFSDQNVFVSEHVGLLKDADKFTEYQNKAQATKSELDVDLPLAASHARNHHAHRAR